MDEHKYKAGDVVKFYDEQTLRNVLDQYRRNASMDYKRSVISLHDRVVTIEGPFNGDPRAYTLDCSAPDMKKHESWIYRDYMFELYYAPEENDSVIPMYGMSYFT